MQEQFQDITPKQKLWEKLNKSGGYTKSYQDFEKQFSSPESIGKLYDHLKDKKYYTKTLDDFNNQFFKEVNQPAQNKVENVVPTTDGVSDSKIENPVQEEKQETTQNKSNSENNYDPSNPVIKDIYGLTNMVVPKEDQPVIDPIPEVQTKGTWRELFGGEFKYDVSGYEMYTPTPSEIEDIGGFENLAKLFEKDHPNVLLFKPEQEGYNSDGVSLGYSSEKPINDSTAKPIDLDALRKERELSIKPFNDWSDDDKMGYFLAKISQGNAAMGFIPEDQLLFSKFQNMGDVDAAYDKDSNFLYKGLSALGNATSGLGMGGTRMLSGLLGVPELLHDAGVDALNGFGGNFKYYDEKFNGEDGLSSLSNYLNGAIDRRSVYNNARYGSEEIFKTLGNGNIEQGVNKILGSIGESGSYTATLMLGNPGTLTAFLASAGGKYNELQKTNPNMDRSVMNLNAQLFSLAEVVPEKIGLNAMMKPYYQLFKKEGMAIAEAQLSKQLRKMMGGLNVLTPHAVEVSTEYATMLMQNSIAKYSGEDPNRKILQGWEDTGIVSLSMSGILSGPGQIANSISDGTRVKQAQKLLEGNRAIELALEKKDITPENRKLLSSMYLINVNKINGYIESEVERKGNLSPKQKEIVRELEIRKASISELLNDPHIPDQIKEQAKNDIEDVNSKIEEVVGEDQVLATPINEEPETDLTKPIDALPEVKIDEIPKNETNTDSEIVPTLSEELKDQDEWDFLIDGGGNKRREEGKVSINGVEYVRQAPMVNAPVGKSDRVKFADGVEENFDYVLVEAKELQPAHNNGVRNNSHFIPEAQPKNRKDKASLKASDNISADPQLRETGANTNAYSGAPVVNERGEVIQGNNRADGLKKHYGQKGNSYKQQLADNATEYGFSSDQVNAMDEPILVRRVSATDEKAIELGNYDVKDIETGGGRRIDPVATSRRIPRNVKSSLIETIFSNNPDSTLNNAIRENLAPLIKKLKPFLNDAQYNTLMREDGTLKPEGLRDIENLFVSFLFEGADVTIQDAFENLDPMVQNGLIKAVPHILSLPSSKGLQSEVQTAIGIVNNFKKSGIESFDTWSKQSDMFNDGKTPLDGLSELEIALARLIAVAKKQSDITNVFKNYHKLVSPFEGDMFSPASDGLTKEKATSEVVNSIKNGKKQGEGKQSGEQASVSKPSNRAKSGRKPTRRSGGESGGADSTGSQKSRGESGGLGHDGSGIYEQAQGSTLENSAHPNSNDGQATKSYKTSSNNQETTQARNNKLTSERIQPRTDPDLKKPFKKKLNQIIGDFVKKLKATTTYSRGGRRGVLGSYRSTDTLTKISRAGDIDTVAHEMGHMLDDRFDILGKVLGPNKQKIEDDLTWFAERGGSNPPSSMTSKQKKEYLLREGLAEYVRALIVHPARAASQGPFMDQHFHDLVDSRTIEIIKGFSDDYLAYHNASAADQTMANIDEMNTSIKEKFMNWLKKHFPSKSKGQFQVNFFDQLNAKFTDSMSIAKKAFRFVTDELSSGAPLPMHKNFDVLQRVFAGVGGKINRIFSHGLIDSNNKVLKDSSGNPMSVKWLLSGLDISSNGALDQDMRDVISLLIAERTVEYSKKFGRTDNLSGIGAGVRADLDVAQEVIDDFEKSKNTDQDRYDRIRDAAQRYRDYANAVLRYAVDKGRISETQYKAIKDGNEFYVAMTRLKESAPLEEQLGYINSSSGKLTSVKEVLHKARGGSDMIQNPYQSLLINTSNLIKESDRNEVMRSFIEPLVNQRAMGEGDPINFAQIARKVSDNGDAHTKTIFVDGEKQVWQFDKDIFESLSALEGFSSGPIMSLLSAPAKLIRTTVTTFPVFAARNITRDTIARIIHSRTGSGFVDFFNKANTEELFELFGGSQAGHHLIDKVDYARKLKDVSKELTKKGVWVLDPRKLGKGYMALLEKGENVNRMAEFSSAYKKAIKEGMSERDASLYAAYQARDLMDFAVAGTWIREVNKIIPFTNAAVQGLVRTAKIMKENPGGFALRVGLYTVLPTIICRGLIYSNGDEEEYAQLPDYQKDLFWNFKVPGLKHWISIPKPFELGLPSSIVDRSIDAVNGNKDAFNGLNHAALEAVLPIDYQFLMGPFKPVVEAIMNKDTFRDREIVPFYEDGKMLSLRPGASNASRLGKAFSDVYSFLPGESEVDPRKVDHIIKGFTTYYGDWAVSLSDLGRDESRNKFTVSKTGFMRETPVSNAKSVTEVKKLAKKLGLSRASGLKELNELIKSYYESTSESERNKISREVWKLAESMRVELKERKAEAKKGQ